MRRFSCDCYDDNDDVYWHHRCRRYCHRESLLLSLLPQPLFSQFLITPLMIHQNEISSLLLLLLQKPHLLNNETANLIQFHIERLESELYQNSCKQMPRVKGNDFVNIGKKRRKNEFYYKFHKFNTKGRNSKFMIIIIII